MFPLEGIMSPVSILKMVVFPAPLTPRSPKHWFGGRKRHVNLNPNQRHVTIVSLILLLLGGNKLPGKINPGIIHGYHSALLAFDKTFSFETKECLPSFFSFNHRNTVYIHRACFTHHLTVHLCAT